MSMLTRLFKDASLTSGNNCNIGHCPYSTVICVHSILISDMASILSKRSCFRFTGSNAWGENVERKIRETVGFQMVNLLLMVVVMYILIPVLICRHVHIYTHCFMHRYCPTLEYIIMTQLMDFVPVTYFTGNRKAHWQFGAGIIKAAQY